MDGFMRALVSVWTDSGFAALTWENVVEQTMSRFKNSETSLSVLPAM